jgi:hypothetical protein
MHPFVTWWDSKMAALGIYGSGIALSQFVYALLFSVTDASFVAPSITAFVIVVIYCRLSNRLRRGPVNCTLSVWLSGLVAKYALLLLVLLVLGTLLYYAFISQRAKNHNESIVVLFLLSIAALGLFVFGTVAALGFDSKQVFLFRR